MSEITAKCPQKRPVFGFMQPVRGGIPNAVQAGTMVNDLHEFLDVPSDGGTVLMCRFCAQEAFPHEWRALFSVEEQRAQETARAAETRAKISIARQLPRNGQAPA